MIRLPYLQSRSGTMAGVRQDDEIPDRLIEVVNFIIAPNQDRSEHGVPDEGSNRVTGFLA
jgi:hypothetical protein